MTDTSTIQHTYEENKKIDQTESLEIVIDFLEENILRNGTKEYVIVEYFPIGKGKDYVPKIYNVINLKMICEDGMIISDSLDNKFQDLDLFLASFLVEDVIYVKFQDSMNMITISFDDGYIRIIY